MIAEDIDALAYVTSALETVPADPAQATEADVGRMAAITAGIDAHNDALLASFKRLETETRSEGYDLIAAIAVAERLRTARARAAQASDLLSGYLERAGRALNHDFDRPNPGPTNPSGNAGNDKPEEGIR